MVEDYLREHQQLALRKLDNGKILWGGVGTGKSRVAVAYYMEKEAPRDVYVITTAKKRDSFDWQDEFYRAGIGPKARADGVLGDTKKVQQRRDQLAESSGASGATNTGQDLDHSSDERSCGSECGSGLGGAGSILHPNYRDRRTDVGGSISTTYPYVVTVDSWNNIAKYGDTENAFFIFDEQRLVGSGDWTRKFLRIAKRNRWILLSGTPGDTWMDYIPVFIANNFYNNRTQFKREHVVYNTFTKFPKVDRYINVGRLARQRSQLLVEMPYVRHTRRRHVEVPLPYDKEALDLVLKKRWHVYEDRPLRDVGEMCSVSRRVVNSDPSRLEMVKEIWKNHPKLIVFYNFNYELDALRTVLTGISYREGTCPRENIGSQKKSLPVQGSKILLGKTTPDGSTTSLARSKKEISTPCLSSIPAYIPCSSTPTTQDPSSNQKISNTNPNSSKLSSRNESKKQSMQLWISNWSNSTLPESEKMLDQTSTSTTSVSEWNGHKHESIPQTDRWLYLVQYRAGAEGWNCIETDAMIMYSRNYSWKVYEQAQGRIDRLNSPFSDLWYYNFTSDSMIDKAIERSLKAKETFNEAKFARLFKD